MKSTPKSLAERRFENAVVRGARAAGLSGMRLLCAVSGGPDSVALLVALARRREPLGLASLGVAHVDHGLRKESRADAVFVGKLAKSLDLPFVVAKVKVNASAGGLEAGARTARYLALEQMAETGGYDAVATGHTRTDQAETVLLRLLRGSGLRGLSAMLPARRLGAGLRLVRPLLGLSGRDTRAYVKAAKLETVVDATNRDRTLRRNALRLSAWPALARIEPALELRLAELASQAREDEAALDALARAAVSSLVRRKGDALSISTEALAALPPAVGRRVLRRMLHKKNPVAQPSAVHLRELLAIAVRGRGEVHVAGAMVGAVVRKRLVLTAKR